MAEIIPLIVIFAVLGIVLFVMLTRRGKGMLFGGRIIKTYDGVSAKRRMIASKIKVQVIDGGGENKVGAGHDVAGQLSNDARHSACG